MTQLLRIATTILLIAYPMVVWWLTQHGYLQLLLSLLMVILALQVVSLGWRNSRSYIAMSALVAIGAIAWLADPLTGVLYYPVWMNLAMLVVFASSLLRPPTVITSLAIAMEGPLSPAAIRYTTNVTAVWTVFFALNGAIAWYTVKANDLTLWALYNGLVSYLLIGLVMIVEWSIRRVVKRRH